MSSERLSSGGSSRVPETDQLTSGESESFAEETRKLTGALTRAELQLATKQRIIDDVLQSLQKCMQEKSELFVLNEVLQKKLDAERIETQKLKQSSNWYRNELHAAQKALRERKGTDPEHSTSEQEGLKDALKKAVSECAILSQKLELEKQRRCNHEINTHHVRYESKDSGIFTESSICDSSSELELSSSSSSTTVDSRTTIAELEKTISYLQQRSSRENAVLLTELEEAKQQLVLKNNLLDLQQKSVSQFQVELEKANGTISSLRKEKDRVVGYLTECRQQVDKLLAENEDLHRESLKMVLRFEKVSSLIWDFRREIEEKDTQFRKLKTSSAVVTDQQCQTMRNVCDKSVQVTSHVPPPSPGNYHKNLLKVIEREHRQKLDQRDMNIRTLIRKVREQMRITEDVERRYQELINAVKLFMGQRGPVTPGENSALVTNDDLVAQLCKLPTDIVIPQEEEESSLSVAECKSCDALRKALEEEVKNAEIERLKWREEEKIREEVLQKRVSEMDDLQLKLKEKSSLVDKNNQLIHLLELETKTLSRSLGVAQRKVTELEKQLLLQSQSSKDSVETERLRYHQVMMLLVQIKNERDELLCQNEDLNKILRGIWLMQEESSKSIATRANEVLKRSAKGRSSQGPNCLQSLREGVDGVRQGIQSLNSAILFRNHGEVSLLDELQAVICEEKGSFSSR